MLQIFPIMLSPIFYLLCLFLCFSEMHCAFILCAFSLCREVPYVIECKWRNVTSTTTYNSLKLGCAPEFIWILEQGSGDISIDPQKL